MAYHSDLIAAGFAHTHHPAEHGDNGGPESGPMPWFNPAYDEYEDGECRMIFERGALVYVEGRLIEQPPLD